jgi:hypothetical protein
MLIECANCGAPLDVAGKESIVTCNYCSKHNRVRQTRTMAARTPDDWRPPPNWTPPDHVPARSVQLQYRAAQAQKSAAHVLPLVVLALMLLLGGVAAAVFARAGGDVGAVVGGVVRGGSGPGSGGVVPPGEHLQWQSSGPPPMVADVDADDVEDIVGFYRLLEGSDSIRYLGAFAGKDLTRIWHTQALGKAGDNLVAAVSGDLVAVTDSNNQLYVLALSDGKPRTSIQLSDRADAMCANPDEPGEIWMQQVDEVTQLLDLKTGKRETAPRPSWCPADADLIQEGACWHQEYQRKRQARAECISPKGFAGSDGFEPEYVLGSGDHRVAMGAKAPGTAIPMAAGYSADGAQVLWTRKLAAPGQTPAPSVVELADLLGDRAVFMYELKGDGARLAALDASTGTTEWDVLIPRSDDGSEASTFRVTSSRVYLPHWTWLEVFDAATGKHVGTIGMW